MWVAADVCFVPVYSHQNSKHEYLAFVWKGERHYCMSLEYATVDMWHSVTTGTRGSGHSRGYVLRTPWWIFIEDC